MRFDAESPTPLRPLQLKAKDVEQWLLDRDPRAINSYREIGPQEYARSFTAARTAGMDVIDDIYFAFVDVVQRGGSETDFQGLVIPTLKAKGWLGGNAGEIASRVALIYDTNLRLARSAGRWDRYQATKSAFPYLRTFTAEDLRVRHPPKSKHSDHRAWDGIILPVGHWWWRRWWPPLGFRCRCGVVQMLRSELARTTGVTSEEELHRRDVLLGEPIFTSPAQPIKTQLADMVQATNDELITGAPPIDPAETEAQGRAMWHATLLAQAGDQVGEALAKLFGL